MKDFGGYFGKVTPTTRKTGSVLALFAVRVVKMA